MTAITLNFTPDMGQAILEGRKCCTSRRSKKGEIGDTFGIDDGLLRRRTYRIADVHRMSWDHIVSNLYRPEGFDSPSACSAYFRAIYPDLHNGRYNTNLYVHWFAAVQE